MKNCCNQDIFYEEDLKRWSVCCSTPLVPASNFYTKQQIDEKLDDIVISGGGITVDEVQEMIDENLDDYYTKDEIDSGFTTVNNELDNKLDISAYTPTDLSNYYTKQETNEAINAATSGIPSSATIEGLRNDVNALSGDVTNLYETKLDASGYTPTDLSQYWTSAQTQSAIDDAISGITGVTIDPSLDSGSTNAVANSAITNAIDAKADATNVYTKNEVNNLVNTKANVWCGDETSFNALTTKDANTIYLVY